jgi:Amidase
MAVKDSWQTSGLRTTSGAPERADYVPEVDASPVARLRDAGAVIFGKRTCRCTPAITSPITRCSAPPTTPSTWPGPPAVPLRRIGSRAGLRVYLHDFTTIDVGRYLTELLGGCPRPPGF